MSYRQLSAVIVTCLIQFACTTDAPRATPAPATHAAAVAPCRSGYGCQCGEEFCTPRGLPCP